EAHALRYVAAHTQIPVPKVLDAYEKDGVTYIFMERLPGEQLSKYIYSEEALPDDVLDKIVEQLRSYVSQLQALRGTYFGSIRENENEEGYTEDIHFKHHPVTVNEISRLFYGPYATRKEYNEGLIVALRNGRWMGELDEGDEELVERIHELDGDERKVFTHGDLHAGNILIDRDEGRVTGIVDFGESGW
ncbi:kinase-like protein, partial [Ascobolus immersus RN42]